MIKNLSDYFLPEQQFYLHKVAYERIDNKNLQEQYSLNCADNITVEIGENNKVKVIVTRSLQFDPPEMFQLSVSFGTDLKLHPQRLGEYDWSTLNLAEEFRDNGQFVTDNLMSRISLLIAQITSSFGQQPLILPPTVAKASEK